MLGVLASAAFGQMGLAGDVRGTIGERPIPALTLLAKADVREDLVLTRTQAEAIDAIVAAGTRRDDELFEGVDRRQTDNALRPPFSTSAQEWEERNGFAIALLTPAQRTRLRALQLQTLGMLAIFQRDLQAELGLSPRQVTELAAADAARNVRRNERLRAFRNDPLSQKEFLAMMADLREEGEAETLAILTPAQRDAYRKILGKPVDSATYFSQVRV